jgi:cytochrome P450
MDVCRLSITLPSLVVIATLVFFTYIHKKYCVWSRQGVRGPKPLPFFGNSFDYGKRPNKDVDIERIKKYGRIFGVYNAMEPMLVVSDPKVLRKILVQDFWSFSGTRENNHWLLKLFLISQNGRGWKDMRSAMTPTFTSGKMKQMLPLMRESLKSLEKAIELVDKSKGVDIKKLFGSYALDVVAKCAFATQADTQDTNDPFTENVRKFFEFNKFKLKLTLLLPTFVKDSLNLTSHPLEAIDYLANISKQIIQNRRQASSNGKNLYVDLLQLLMTTRKTNDDKVDKHADDGSFLSDNEIVANIILFLLAGYDTVATSLAYTAYSLALNPVVQDKLRKEIVDAVQSTNGDLSYDLLSGLKYLDAVVSETLRMYPPATRVERIATEDYAMESEEGTIEIKKGTVIYIPIYAIHHDEEFYPNPEEYQPERFLAGNKEHIISYTYLPFVSGPRNCIGMRFALLEIKLALASLILRNRFARVDETSVPLDFSHSVNFLRAKEVVIGIEPFEKLPSC